MGIVSGVFGMPVFLRNTSVFERCFMKTSKAVWVAETVALLSIFILACAADLIVIAFGM